MVFWKIDSYLTVRVLENRLLFNSTCTAKYPPPFQTLVIQKFNNMLILDETIIRVVNFVVEICSGSRRIQWCSTRTIAGRS